MVKTQKIVDFLNENSKEFAKLPEREKSATAIHIAKRFMVALNVCQDNAKKRGAVK